MGNQIAISTTMVGMCESMLYAHKAGLDVEEFLEAISGGAAGSKSLDLYSARIVKRDMAPGFMVRGSTPHARARGSARYHAGRARVLPCDSPAC